MALLIDGKKIAAEIRAEVKAVVDRLRAEQNTVPGLAFILVGEDPASQSYVRMKGKACEEVGFHSVTDRLPESIKEVKLLERIRSLNADHSIHGILVQLPLPGHINESRVISAIDPAKDVDGFHPVNVGKLVIGEETLRPCTAAGIQELLIRSHIDVAGKHVVVVGRSNIVGKPIANILLQKQKGANAVVTVVHTGAKDLEPYLRSADILIAAIGKPEVIRGEHLKPGVVVVDVGINRVEDPSQKNGYRIVGDVHFESASKVAGAITPVPGGVGPMTIALLLKNTLQACRATVL
ncbi:MAG: bifunctional methylenetetrahydrofolate dehydrogenase/methenyltetrahydrofolate cyclohydrolase FolD [Bacteroidota bacterium]